jgi:hypothetical protein
VTSLLASGLLALTACASTGPGAPAPDATGTSRAHVESECAEAVTAIVQATGRYVDSYAEGSAEVRAAGSSPAPRPSGARSATPSASPTTSAYSDAEFQRQLAGAQQVLVSLGCDPAGTRAALEVGLGGLSPRGAVADAVLRQLTAGLTGRLAQEPQVRAVSPGEDLMTALAESAAGSTLELAAGEFQVGEPLVLLTGVVIRGAGRDRTSIVSTAGEAAVLVLTDGRVELRDLTIRHEGKAPASAILGGPAAALVVTGSRLTGAVSDAAGQGGSGILMFGTGTEGSGRGTSVEVTDADLSGNHVAGLVLGGGHRASVVRSEFRDNGQCGVCFLDASDGSVQGSTFTANGVGVAVTGSARPSLVDLTITGGQVGIQAGDTAAPAVSGVSISGSARAAMIYSGKAAGRIDGAVCTKVPFGIVIGAEAYPDLGANRCTVAPTR